MVKTTQVLAQATTGAGLSLPMVPSFSICLHVNTGDKTSPVQNAVGKNDSTPVMTGPSVVGAELANTENERLIIFVAINQTGECVSKLRVAHSFWTSARSASIAAYKQSQRQQQKRPGLHTPGFTCLNAARQSKRP